ncbi:MAG: serine/threonine-protein kinase [Candidatus Gastranaerophilales bacterium]|nr:serine/threonine-protein kinase [Candidatus Gastranaerophilales bacterium]
MIITIGSIIYDDNRNEYIVIESIGSGGFGNVFKIKDVKTNAIFALKTLPTEYPNEATLNSFIQEAKSAIKINHTHIIKYWYFHDGQTYKDLPPYIIMEYANNGTLDQFIKEQSDYIENQRLSDIFSQLISGMKEINSKLVHRDIKPQNILIDKELFKISDFGLSKFADESTRTKTFKGYGSELYFAPEAWGMQKNTIQIDIYSMGIVFFQLATLKYPYDIPDNKDYKSMHLYQQAKNPQSINEQLSLAMSQVILKMLEKNTSKRYANWSDIITDLSKVKTATANNSVSSMVDFALRVKVQQDNTLKAEELKKKQRQEEITEINNLVEYQLKESIINPIKEFINTYNQQYIDGNQIIFNKEPFSSENFCYAIKTSSRKELRIEVQTVLPEKCHKKEYYTNWHSGQRATKQVNFTPKLDNKVIQAWGYINHSSGAGYNLILAKENESDIYGSWYTLTNTNSGLSTQRRTPEPFAFDFLDLITEIDNIHALHIYNTQVAELDKNLLLNFLIQYNS